MQFTAVMSVIVTTSHCTERLGTKGSHPKEALASLTIHQNSCNRVRSTLSQGCWCQSGNNFLISAQALVPSKSWH